MKEIVWNSQKNKTNKTKHGISFDEAAAVFFDLLSLTVADDEHSWEERRFITIGRMSVGKLIVVFHTETETEIRIFSARKPIRIERLNYEEH